DGCGRSPGPASSPQLQGAARDPRIREVCEGMTSTAGSVTPVSTLIDVLARDLTLRWPDRVLIGLDHVMLGKRPRSDADRSLRVEVVRDPPTLVAHVMRANETGHSAPLQPAAPYP